MSERELTRIEVLSQGRMTAVTAATVFGLSRRQVHRLLRVFQSAGPATSFEPSAPGLVIALPKDTHTRVPFRIDRPPDLRVVRQIKVQIHLRVALCADFHFRIDVL